MAIEIERKFLVADQGWRNLATKSQRLRDGLIAHSDGHKVRVRIYQDRATLTVKSIPTASVRTEFEYEIPGADAEELLAHHCSLPVLEKIRHYVPYQGFTWEIDVYEGLLGGVIIAEVELAHADIPLPIPGWIGREVTSDPAYRKFNMVQARLASTR